MVETQFQNVQNYNVSLKEIWHLIDGNNLEKLETPSFGIRGSIDSIDSAKKEKKVSTINPESISILLDDNSDNQIKKHGPK